MSELLLRSGRVATLFVGFILAVTLASAQLVPVTTYSDAARVQFLKGRTAVHNSEWSRSIPYFEAALALDPDFALAHLYHAIATEEGREAHLRQALAQKAKVSEGEAMHIESFALGQRDDIDGEVAMLKQLAVKYPSDPQPMMIAAYLLQGRGEPREAVAAAKASIETDPGFAPAYNMLGYAEMTAGNMAGAEQAFRDYLRVAPSVANAHDSYGEFLMNAGRLDEAKKQFGLALTLDPGFGGSRQQLTRIAIMEATAAHVDAINRQDIDGMMDFFTANAVMSLPDGSQIKGRDAIRAACKTYFDAGKITSVTETQEIMPMGDDHVYHRTAITNLVDGKVIEKGIDTYIWVRTADGWKIARDTWTSSVPPAAPAEKTKSKKAR